MSDTSNPYEVTSVAAAEDGLPSDTEFLFSDKYIAGNSTINLPRVCIRTGSRKDLLRRTRVLRYRPRMLFIILVVAFGLWGSFAGSMTYLSFSVGPVGLPAPRTSFSQQPEQFTWLIITILLSVLLLTSVALWFLRRETVTVKYSVSEGAILQARRELAVWILGTLIVLGLCVVAAGAAGVFGLTLMMFSAATAILIFKSVRGAERVSIAGKVDGLYLLAGISPECLGEIGAIVRRR